MFPPAFKTFPFKMLMVYLLVRAAGSRGRRFYRNNSKQTGVVDNHSADQGEAKTMQGIRKHPAKLYQEEYTAISAYDPPSELALRRQTCIKKSYLKGDKTYFECKSDCCCRAPQKIEVSCVKDVCKKCLYRSQCRSADQGEAKTMQGIRKHPAKLYQEGYTAISYDPPSHLALRRQTCIKKSYLKGDKTYFECKSDCCCRAPQKIAVSCVKDVCKECLYRSQCQSG